MTSILAKVGIEGVGSNLAAAIRTMVVLIMAWGMVFITHQQDGIRSISQKSWFFLILSGLATGASWLCYHRHHAEEGKWLYTEHRNYDYNAIEDPRLYGFECFLRLLRYGFPPDRWERKVQVHIALMNYWYQKPHWDYDRKKLCFIEISDSKEHDGDGMEELRPGSVFKIMD